MRFIVEMEWNRPAPIENGNDLEALKEIGIRHATKMVDQGYVAGELSAEIQNSDDECDVEHYRGWWTHRCDNTNYRNNTNSVL